MAKQAELVAEPREITGKATRKLRQTGKIPANIFGHNEQPLAVQIASSDFEMLRREHRTTGVISLKIAGKKAQTALIRHVQRNPLNGHIIHIDFFRVSLRERITAKVPLHFTGVAPGVKVEGGVLLHLLEALEVECEAGDLVEALEVDISELNQIDDLLHAKDVKLPANYTLITDPEEPVVKVTPPRAEKVEEAPTAAATEAPEAPAAGASESASAS